MTQGWQTHGRSTRDRRRKKQQRAPRTLSESVKPVAVKEPTEATRTEATRPAAGSSGWRQTPVRASANVTIRPEEYSYVYSDLKRIAILSAGIFAILIALSFII